MEIEIRTKNLRTGVAAPLYVEGVMWTTPVAYVRMTEDGFVYTYTNAEADGRGTDEDAYYGRAVEWEVDMLANGESLARLLESEEVRRLLQAVHDGHTIVDGRGILDESSEFASLALAEIFNANSGRCAVEEYDDSDDE